MDFFESNQTVFWMVGICGFFVLMLLFSKQFKFLLKFILRGAIGLCAVFLSNLTIGPIIGASIGINLINACIIGILGAPGFFLLIVASCFL